MLVDIIFFRETSVGRFLLALLGPKSRSTVVSLSLLQEHSDWHPSTRHPVNTLVLPLSLSPWLTTRIPHPQQQELSAMGQNSSLHRKTLLLVPTTDWEPLFTQGISPLSGTMCFSLSISSDNSG